MKNLKRKLEYHYKAFDKSTISPDPLEFLHKYKYETDIEVSGIFSSTFAFGNVKQILRILNEIHSVMGESPYDFLMNFDEKKHAKYFSGMKYRFFSEADIVALFRGLSEIYKNYGSLRYLFLLYHSAEDKNLKESISHFSENLLKRICNGNEPTHGIKFMFPDPLKGSAAKRLNLFLRWMIRKDELDFGLWTEINPSQLVIPVDTHIARICTELNLTTKKNVSWNMAEEITENLKKYCKEDPVKYDFAICHIGMRNLKF